MTTVGTGLYMQNTKKSHEATDTVSIVSKWRALIRRQYALFLLRTVYWQFKVYSHIKMDYLFRMRRILLQFRRKWHLIYRPTNVKWIEIIVAEECEESQNIMFLQLFCYQMFYA